MIETNVKLFTFTYDTDETLFRWYDKKGDLTGKILLGVMLEVRSTP